MPDVARTIEKEAAPENLGAFLDFVHAFLGEVGAPEPFFSNVRLAAAELCNNIIRHAYNGLAGPLSVTCAREGDVVRLSTVDRGRGFDPASVPEPDIAAPLEARRDGGMGLFLVRQVMDSVEYARAADGTNRWRLTKRLRG